MKLDPKKFLWHFALKMKKVPGWFNLVKINPKSCGRQSNLILLFSRTIYFPMSVKKIAALRTAKKPFHYSQKIFSRTGRGYPAPPCFGGGIRDTPSFRSRKTLSPGIPPHPPSLRCPPDPPPPLAPRAIGCGRCASSRTAGPSL